MILTGVRLFLRGGEIIKLKHEDIVGKLAVYNSNDAIECLPIDILGKEEDEALSALAIWSERELPHLDLMRHFMLLSSVIGVNSGHMFVNVIDLEVATNDNSLIKNINHIRHDTF